MAYTINSRLVTVFLVAIPILAVAVGILISMSFPRFTAMLKKYDSMNGSGQENLIAIRVVKAFVRSKYEKEKFRDANQELMDASIKEMCIRDRSAGLPCARHPSGGCG